MHMKYFLLVSHQGEETTFTNCSSDTCRSDRFLCLAGLIHTSVKLRRSPTASRLHLKENVFLSHLFEGFDASPAADDSLSWRRYVFGLSIRPSHSREPDISGTHEGIPQIWNKRPLGLKDELSRIKRRVELPWFRICSFFTAASIFEAFSTVMALLAKHVTHTKILTQWTL